MFECQSLKSRDKLDMSAFGRIHIHTTLNAEVFFPGDTLCAFIVLLNRGDTDQVTTLTG